MNQPSLVSCSAHELLHLYFSSGHVTDPQIFGLESFSKESLGANDFYRAGYDDFYLMEKWFRLSGRATDLNFKVYFKDGVYESNGIDLHKPKLTTVLEAYAACHGEGGLVKKIQLHFDAEQGHGSLVVNDFFDLIFNRSHESRPLRNKFHLRTVASDFSASRHSGKTHTDFVRRMKPYVSFARARKKYRNDPAMRELIACLVKHFPEACALGDADAPAS